MEFIKAETNGNDFIIIENANCDNCGFDIKQIADRNTGVGADQIIFFRKQKDSAIYDVEFFNSDGSTANMCGNGLCALTKHINAKIIPGEISYNISNTLYRGYTDDFGMSCIVVKMPFEIKDMKIKNCKIINTGNKHIVSLDRNEELFSHLNEYNVHFIEFLENGAVIGITTYERGAGKTAACGSGAIAVAFAYGKHGGINHIKHEGGDSYVDLSKDDVVILKTRPTVTSKSDICL